MGSTMLKDPPDCGPDCPYCAGSGYTCKGSCGGLPYCPDGGKRCPAWLKAKLDAEMAHGIATCEQSGKMGDA